MEKENCILISSRNNWIEQAAKDQLMGISKLPGVVKAAGLPDLHPGKFPVGVAVLTRGRFYPHFIGNDIGCGMSLFDTGVRLKKFRQDTWVSRLNHIRELGDIPASNPYGEECPFQDLGTIGSGNHFAEFQCVEEVYDDEAVQKLGLNRDHVLLLIHSGSRGYGQEILKRYFRPEGLEGESVEAQSYLNEHNKALIWSARNRAVTAKKLQHCVDVSDTPHVLLECCHNYLEQTEDGWLHRKGCVSAKKGAVVIPGSRGSLTYLCIPTQDTQVSLDSLSHGAGRKWARSICRSRINKKYDKDSIRSTKLKSRVVCHDTNLLFQEAPEAYKNIDQVIQSLQDYGLIEVAAVFRPLITYKG